MIQSASNCTPNQAKANAAVDADVERQTEDVAGVLRDYGSQERPRKKRMLGWPIRPRSIAENFPLKKTSTTQGASCPATALHIQAIELLFGLPADHASKWPGIIVFCHHLDSCFEELLDPRFDIIWKILRRDSPSATVDCWYWCFAVIESFQALHDDASIEKAYQRLIENAEKSLHEIKAHEKIQVLRAMFAVLCWTSATLKPLLGDEATAATTDATNPEVVQNSSLGAENSSEIHSSKDLRRPISKMFYSFRNHVEDVEESEHQSACGGTKSSGSSNNDDVLYESSLNFFSLFTIGRVRLKWVNTLTAHLAFDRSTRTLSVFRFPSLCVTNVLRKHDVKVLKNITAKLLPSHYYTDSPQEPSALHREVLLSYRLLFGQSYSARKLLGQLLSQSSSSTATTHSNHPTTNHHCSHSSSDAIIDDFDPLLAIICTSPLPSRWRRLSFSHWGKPSPLLPSNIFPSSALDLNDQLQESETYSARDDFTVFGPRLLTLQRYNMRQQPSKVKDLWRDRRNPLQWYTFWAVLWIGGASLVIAVLQLLVGVTQLYFAGKS